MEMLETYVCHASQVRRHPATDGEVRALCGDLQVLGRSEFKALLRWRTALRKALGADIDPEGAEAKAEAKAKGGKGGLCC